MMYFRYLRASQSSSYCVGAGDGMLSLISVTPLQHSFSSSITEGVDSRISVSSKHRVLIYADFYSGVTAIEMGTNRLRWKVKIKGVTKLRISQDEEVLIVCRNKPPEVDLILMSDGQIIEKVAGVTDGFLESLKGGSAFLNLKDELLLCKGRSKMAVQWGQFAIHSGCFAGEKFYASGTNSTIAAYDMTSLQPVAMASQLAFSRCNPIAWSARDQRLLGVLFEPEDSPSTQLVAFDESLSIDSVIASMDLVLEAVIFDQSRSMFTSDGKLLDTSSGQVKGELER